MTPAEFRAALDRLSLTQEEAAMLLGVGLRTAHGYANGRPIPKGVGLLLELLLRRKRVRPAGSPSAG